MQTDTPPLTAAQLPARLVALVAARAAAVAQLERTTEDVIAVRHAWDGACADLWLSGALDAVKPAERREAALRERTSSARWHLTQAEQAQRQARAQLETIDAELSVLRALCYFLGRREMAE